MITVKSIFGAVGWRASRPVSLSRSKINTNKSKSNLNHFVQFSANYVGIRKIDINEPAGTQLNKVSSWGGVKNFNLK